MQRCGLELGALILPGDSDALSADADADAGEVVPFFPDLPRTAKFTNLRRKRADLSGAQRTAYHFDRRCAVTGWQCWPPRSLTTCGVPSAMLDELLTDEFGGDWRELLGELQLAFVLFLQLSSMAALEQWKQVLTPVQETRVARLETHCAAFPRSSWRCCAPASARSRPSQR